MRVRVLGLALLVCVSAASAGGTQGVSARQMPEFGILARSDPASSLDVLSAFRGASVAASSVPVKDPKLDSHLVELTAAQLATDVIGPPELPPDLQSMITAGLMRLDAGRVQVYAESLDGVVSVAGDVDRAGGLVQREDAPSGIVQALVPISQIERLAASPSVKLVRLPDYGVTNAGSKTTEGDAILKADLARSDHALDGAGVRVGVISNGVGGLSQSEASGDLPSVNTTTCNETGADPTSTGTEATAMMEIVHDLAPGAELWFGEFSGSGGFGTSVDFDAAVSCLASHTDVVVDDISFLGTGPYDGTSTVSANTSAQLNESTNPVRAYVTNAGNFVQQHYKESYKPCQSTTLQTFQSSSQTVDTNGFGSGCGDPLLVPPGASLAALLDWNDPWGASCNDYDLYLFTLDGTLLLASSLNEQSCSQNPQEVLAWVNPLSVAVVVQVVVDNFDGAAATRQLNLFTTGLTGEGSVPLNFFTSRSSIPNQADAGGGVITTGAISEADSGHNDIETYSDQGPTADGRTKPDITAIDCVSVTGVGGFGSPFCGTSAASPHIAGIAALLLQCKASLLAGEPGDNPSSDRSALRSALLSHAVDLGQSGDDNIYGAGRADAAASADAICQSGTVTPTPTHSPSPSPTHSPSPTPTQSARYASDFAWFNNEVPPPGHSACDFSKPVPPSDPNASGLCVKFNLHIPDGTYAFGGTFSRDGVIIAEGSDTVQLHSAPDWQLSFDPPAPKGTYHVTVVVDGELLGESTVVVVGAPIRGNANCDDRIDGSDVIAVLDAVEALGTPAGCLANADVDGDGFVTPFDALLIMKYWAGLISTFPAGG